LAREVPYGHHFQALYPFYGAEKFSEDVGGSWQALTRFWTYRLVYGVRIWPSTWMLWCRTLAMGGGEM